MRLSTSINEISDIENNRSKYSGGRIILYLISILYLYESNNELDYIKAKVIDL